MPGTVAVSRRVFSSGPTAEPAFPGPRGAVPLFRAVPQGKMNIDDRAAPESSDRFLGILMCLGPSNAGRELRAGRGRKVRPLAGGHQGEMVQAPPDGGPGPRRSAQAGLAKVLGKGHSGHSRAVFFRQRGALFRLQN